MGERQQETDTDEENSVAGYARRSNVGVSSSDTVKALRFGFLF